MSDKRYELVKPTVKLVKQYNDFWYKSNELKDEDWQVELFIGIAKSDIRTYIPVEKFVKYGEDDKCIKKMYDDNKIDDFFKKINSTYSTRLNVDGLNITKQVLEKSDVDGLVGEIKNKKGKYAYSFSTKVYSFIKPECFPIMDSLVSTLLWYYMNEEYKKINTKNIWGKYNKYKEAYDCFKKDNGLEGMSYKQIDVFLWTYAIVIQKYWEKQGVMRFESVIYKEPSKK